MTLNLQNILFSSNNSSLKIWKQDSGTVSLPAITSSTGGSVYTTVTIAHGYPNDNLIWQVGFNENDGTYHNAMMSPFESGDGSLNAFATLDATNLYISIGWQTNSSIAATSFQYIYRILIP